MNIAVASAALVAAPSIVAIPTPAAASAVSLMVSAAIDRYRTAEAASSEAYIEWDDAETAAGKKHGHRPSELIHWRNYYIGASEIEDTRDRLLDLRYEKVDSSVIEEEYIDARKRMADQIKRARKWDRKTGTAHLERRRQATLNEFWASVNALAAVEPSSSADALALLAVVCKNLNANALDDWERDILLTANDYLQSCVSAAA
jgi:hypothetical protein